MAKAPEQPEYVVGVDLAGGPSDPVVAIVERTTGQLVSFHADPEPQVATALFSAITGVTPTFQDFLEFERDQEARRRIERARQEAVPPPAWPHDVDNADILMSIDVLLAHNGSNPLAAILARLPVEHRNGEWVSNRPSLRCIGGPRATQLVPADLQAVWSGRDDSDPTHHYVEKSATWNGLTLRWYEWEKRPTREELVAKIKDAAERMGFQPPLPQPNRGGLTPEQQADFVANALPHYQRERTAMLAAEHAIQNGLADLPPIAPGDEPTGEFTDYDFGQPSDGG